MLPVTGFWNISQRIDSVRLALVQTGLAEAQSDNKIAEVTLAYSAGGSAQLQIDPTLR